MTETREGACLCGTVRYEITLPLSELVHCHCSMCRKHHGAPFATYACVPEQAFRWLAGEESVGRFQSSEHIVRAFCTKCGSVAPTIMDGQAVLPAGNLLGDLGLKPQAHIFATSKASWYSITDDLPQYEGYRPQYGGSPGVVVRAPRASRPGVISGSCLCGDVTWEIGKPRGIMNCHCSRCRRGRSAAHTSNLFAAIEEFRWTGGESQVREYKVPDARYFAVAFCTRCGGSVPRISRERGIVVVPAGALDSDPGLQPRAHIFVGSKASWYEITDSLPQHAELPPSFF